MDPRAIIGLTAAALVFGIIWFFCWRQRQWEKRMWNGGVSRACGTPWTRFDTDSQGGRGYNCGCGMHGCWISYAVDR